MSLPITSNAYRVLLQDDIDWLLKQPRTLERDHIEAVLRFAIVNAKEICDKAWTDYLKREPKA